MTDLSPAAQAVLDAWDAVLDPEVTCLTRDPEREALAAALRAAANQLPLQPLTRKPADPFEEGLRQGQELSRAELLAIAAELEHTP